MFRLITPLPICTICRRTLWTSRYLFSETDYHKILGLSKDCNRKELKKRYVELSKQYHPDVIKSDNLNEDEANMKFQQINEAYRILMKKYSKPKRVLVQTRGYKPKSEGADQKDQNTSRTESQTFEDIKVSSKPRIVNSHGWNILIFMFAATLTIKIIAREDWLMYTRKTPVDGKSDEVAEQIAAQKFSKYMTIYMLLGIPLLIIYMRYWNRFGRG